MCVCRTVPLQSLLDASMEAQPLMQTLFAERDKEAPSAPANACAAAPDGSMGRESPAGARCCCSQGQAAADCWTLLCFRAASLYCLYCLLSHQPSNPASPPCAAACGASEDSSNTPAAPASGGGGKPPVLVSGAGHDAMVFADVTKMGMLFVRCRCAPLVLLPATHCRLAQVLSWRCCCIAA